MVTLDIGDTVIKMVVVKGRKVKLAVSLDLEAGLVEDGVVLDKATVSQKIKQLIDAYGITEKNVVVSISGVHSIYRLIRMPHLPGKLMEEAVRREMGRAMPVPLNEIYTSWCTETISSVENVVCLVGLPRNTVDAMLETLRGAGLDSRVMDVRPLAMARIVDERNALIINVQPLSFDIVVMIDGIPELLRSLLFPHKDLSESDKLEMIKDEVERTVSFYNSSHKENPMTTRIAAFISGDQSDVLAEKLHYIVKPFPEVLSYPEGFTAGDYVINIGLALKQIKAGQSQIRINVNTIPVEYLPKPRSVIEVVSWAFVPVAVIVLVSTAVLMWQALAETSVLQVKVDNARERTQAMLGTTGDTEKLQARLTKVRAELLAYQPYLDSSAIRREKVSDDLSMITTLLPGTITLDSIIYEEGPKEKKWNISGTASDEAVILGYCADLDSTARFDHVIVLTMAVRDYNEVDFTAAFINKVE